MSKFAVVFSLDPNSDYWISAEYYRRREDIELLELSANASFKLVFEELGIKVMAADSGINFPIDLYIVTHSNPFSWMRFPAGKDDKNGILYNSLASGDNYSENLENLKIPTTLLPLNLHIRGCNIGQSEEFLKLLKWWLAGWDDVNYAKISITAPKYNYQILKHQNGIMEGFHHELSVRRTKNSLMIDPSKERTEEKKRIKEELVKAFVEENKTWDENDFVIDDIGKIVPDDLYLAGNKEKKEHKDTVNLSFKDVVGVPKVLQLPWYVRYKFSIEKTRIYLAGNKTNLKSLPIMHPRYPVEVGLFSITGPSKFDEFVYPDYKRLGYDSFDEFFDGFDWNCIAGRCIGSFNYFRLYLPITENNKIICNYMSATNDMLINDLDSKLELYTRV